VEQQPDRRKHRRFVLQQTATVQSVNGPTSEVAAITENVSLGGVLLSVDAAIAHQSEVKVHIRLQRNGLQDVSLQALGTVLRVDPSASGKHLVAIELERPLSATQPRD